MIRTYPVMGTVYYANSRNLKNKSATKNQAMRSNSGHAFPPGHAKELEGKNALVPDLEGIRGEKRPRELEGN